MSSNLLKRIFTSFFLLIFLYLSLFINSFIWLISLILISFVCFSEFSFMSKKICKNDKNFFFTNIITVLFLIVFIYSAFNLYENPPKIILFIILICIFSDTGGYICGKLIGGKKLSKISPNKTISGTIGSFIFSLGPILIFSILFKLTGNKIYFQNLTIFLIFNCLFLSLVCQLGDLFISYFKRKAKVKDTGTKLPGHGGFLDRIDGMIFVIPISYLLEKIIF